VKFDRPLAHYAKDRVTLDCMKEYVQPDYVHSYGKPTGLWVSSVGPDDWESWCMRERFDLEGLRRRHYVSLASNANILYLTNVEMLKAFHEIYANRDGIPHRMCGINWAEVAKDYQGIIITPYQPRMRYYADWYYGWDCASGCIWDLTAIVRFSRKA
jgi:hypothetical protein